MKNYTKEPPIFSANLITKIVLAINICQTFINRCLICFEFAIKIAKMLAEWMLFDDLLHSFSSSNHSRLYST